MKSIWFIITQHQCWSCLLLCVHYGKMCPKHISILWLEYVFAGSPFLSQTPGDFPKSFAFWWSPLRNTAHLLIRVRSTVHLSFWRIDTFTCWLRWSIKYYGEHYRILCLYWFKLYFVARLMTSDLVLWQVEHHLIFNISLSSQEPEYWSKPCIQSGTLNQEISDIYLSIIIITHVVMRMVGSTGLVDLLLEHFACI